MLTRAQEGFTLIEITIAIMILTVAVLGIAASTGRMVQPAAEAELEFQALQAAEDRLTLVSLDPRYPMLDSLYSATETALPGLDGLKRTTEVSRARQTMEDGRVWDRTRVVVTLQGGALRAPVARTLVLGAP